MARVTVEDCLEKMSNRFLLVHLGAKRVIQLRKGATPFVEAPKNKEVVLALREIAAGEVTFDNIVQIDQVELVAQSPEDSTEAPEAGGADQEDKKEAESPKDESSDSEEVEPEDSPDDKAK
jgi:DNA-directed RNA polymerase subunit omega